MQKAAIGLALMLLFWPLRCDTASPGLLKIVFLDVGQGDGIYIEAPNGAQIVVDGGPAGSLLGPLADEMPFGDRKINALVVTNPDTDHYAGFLDLLATYEVGAVIEPGTVALTGTHKKLQEEIAARGIPELMARKGMILTLDVTAGVRLRVLFPDRDVSAWSTNDGSMIAVLEYGTTRVMLTGDTTKRAEGLLLAAAAPADLQSDILKVAHHGSTTSSSEAFVRAVGAKHAVISVGRKNKYGLPKKATLDTLAQSGAEILRTDEAGTVVFLSDGERVWREE